MKKPFQERVQKFLGVSLLFFSVSYFPFFPLELFTHFRWHLLLLSMLSLLLLRGKSFFLVIGAVLIQSSFLFFQGETLLPGDIQNTKILSPKPKSPTKTYRLILFNILNGNQNLSEIFTWLIKQDADFVFIVEIYEDFLHEMPQDFRSLYPHSYGFLNKDNFGLGIYSKYLLSQVRKPGYGPREIPWIEAKIPRLNLDFALLHAPPPLSAQTLLERDRILHLAASRLKTSRAFLLGDFNLTPFSPLFRDLLLEYDLCDSRMGAYFGSWPAFLPGLRIPIDHMLFKDGIEVLSRTSGPSLGSDHNSVIIEFQLP